MSALDEAERRLDAALGQLERAAAALVARASRPPGVPQSEHDALLRDFELIRAEQERASAALEQAERQRDELARRQAEAGARLDKALAEMDRLLEA